jgi:subtilisin family serine protease
MALFSTFRRTCLRPFRVALGAILFAFAYTASAQPSGPAPAIQGVSASAMTQIAALLAEKEQRTATQQKIDSQLLYGANMAARGEAAPGVPSLEVNLRYLDAAGTQLVLVDVRTNAMHKASGRVVEKILKLGGQVLENVEQFNAIHAAVPLLQIEALADMAEVRFVSAAGIRENDTGSVNSQGDAAMGSDVARATYSPNTAGMKVCVISDSASPTGVANSIANGNLTAGKVTILPGQAGSGSDEGVAMMEIINDIAPGVQMFFATSGGSEASFAQNILDLYNNYRCDVMVDDIRFSGELPFQDAVIARAVNTVTAAGTIYFASAGNSGNKTDGTSGTWVGDFVNGGAFTVPTVGTSYEVHSFQTAPSVQNYNVVNSGGSSYALSLFWSDPEAGSSNDYDLFRLSADGASLLSSSTNVQNGTQNPAEFTTAVATGNHRVVVVRKIGAANRALYLSTGRGRLAINTNGFARGHSAAPNALATAAVPAAGAIGAGQPTGPFPGQYTASQQTELFSSDGPARKFFNPDGSPVTPGNFLIGTGGGLVQQYPVVTGPDGVSTSVPGFTTFYGTSAAAPHAAAVAALVKGRNPALTAAQIRNVLTSTALDIEAPGVDSDTGYGILRPINALAAVSPAAYPSAGSVAAPIAESLSPANGFVDPGETVTVNLPITNVGSAPFVNLVGTLLVGLGVSPVPPNPLSYGALGVGATASLPFTFTAAGNCGDTITLTLQLQDGATSYGSVTYKITLGTSQTTTTLVENFDGVTAPALPAGWTSTVVSGSIANWVTTTATPDSGVNALLATPVASTAELRLDSPLIAIPAGSGSNRISFRHRWNTESGYDGGVLEISIAGGAFADILTAGGSFVSGGYNGIISTADTNPLGGRAAWMGAADSAYITTVFTLPPAASGQNIRLRFRLGTDSCCLQSGTNSWRIDTFERLLVAPVCTAAIASNVTLGAVGPIHRGQQSTVTATVSASSGTPAGSVFVSGAGASCNITLSGATGSCALLPTIVGASQTLVGSYSGDATHAGAIGNTALTVKSTLDVDNDGASTAATDGVLAVRYLLGLRGAALVSGIAFAGGAQRTDPTAIASYLQQVSAVLDVDADTHVYALTDGLMLIRYLLGLRGAALVAGATGAPGAGRTLPADLQNYIQGLIQ